MMAREINYDSISKVITTTRLQPMARTFIELAARHACLGSYDTARYYKKVAERIQNEYTYTPKIK